MKTVHKKEADKHARHASHGNKNRRDTRTAMRKPIKARQAALLVVAGVTIAAGYVGERQVHSQAIRQNRPWIEVSSEFRRMGYTNEELAYERTATMQRNAPLNEGAIFTYTEKNPRKVDIRTPATDERLIFEAMDLMKHTPISEIGGQAEAGARTWYDFFRSSVESVTVDTLVEGGPVARADFGPKGAGMIVYTRSFSEFYILPNKDRIFHLAAILVHEAAHNHLEPNRQNRQISGEERFRHYVALVAQKFGLKMRQPQYMNSLDYYFTVIGGILDAERDANSIANRFLLDFKKVDSDAHIEPMLRKNDTETARYRKTDAELNWHVYSHLAKVLGFAIGIFSAVSIAVTRIRDEKFLQKFFSCRKCNLRHNEKRET